MNDTTSDHSASVSRLKRTSTWVDVGDDVWAHNVNPYGDVAPGEGHAQISIGPDVTVGISGTPKQLQHLAAAIAGAARELDALLDVETRQAHYEALAEQSRQVDA